MNINEFFDNPTIQVKNPQYTGKRDKKHPPTIPQHKTMDNSPDLYRDFSSAIGTHGNIRTDISEKDWNKYNDYGVTVSARSSLDDLDTEVAEHQSNWTKFGNMIVQTVAGELVLGTAGTVTDLGGILIDVLTTRAFKKDYDFSNPVSDKIEEWRKGIEEEFAPIHTKPGEDVSNGGLADPGWYFSGVPSLVSTLTLLLPTKLAAKGIGLAAKGIRSIGKARRSKKLMDSVRKGEEVLGATGIVADEAAAKTLNAVQKHWYDPITRLRTSQAAKVSGEAAIMRTLENYQEAGQTYGDMYTETLSKLKEMKPDEYKDFVSRNEKHLNGVDTNDKEAVAKTVAHAAATRTFWMDYSNTIFDVIQLNAIRNIGKLAKNVKSPKVMKLQRESKMTANLDDTAIAAAAPKGVKKALTTTKDFIKGIGKLSFAESTEGIEEAVNFIAQQEGMTLGQSMLSREVDSSWGDFWNRRLHDYLNMPGLWESAFWGVAGGVAFGYFANFHQKRQIYKRNKQLEKERGENAETKEKMDLASWITMSETPEVEAAINAIGNRRGYLDKLSRQLKLIEDKKNPFDPSGQNQEWTEQIELNQALARQRAITEYRQKLAIEAINSGTYDLLVDYMRAEPVREAMVKAGVTEEDGSKELIEETIRDLEATKKMYHEELAQVHYQAIALNKANRGAVNLPLEYIQMIANKNVDTRLRMQAIDRSVNRFMKQIAEIEGNEKSIDVKNQIRLAKLIDTWARLEAQKKEIKEGRAKDQNGNPLTAWRVAESIMDIQDKQTAMLNQIKNDNLSVWTEGATVTNPENGDNVNSQVRSLATMLYTLRRGSSYYKDGVDFFINAADETFKLNDEQLINTFEEWFKDKPKDVSVATISAIAKQVEQSQDAIAKRIEELQNNNVKLFDLYNAVSDLEIQRNSISSELVRSQTELRNEVDKLHNRTNHLREELVEDCTEVIRKIHAKYIDTNARDVEEAVIQHFFNNREQAYTLARQKLTGKDENGVTDAEKLISALKRLNFSYGANRELMATLEWILRAQDEKYKKTKVKPTEFENPSQSSQNQPTNTTSQTTSETPQGAETAQKSNVDNRPTAGVVLTLHGDGSITTTPKGVIGTGDPRGENVSSVTRVEVVIRENPDGTSEIKLEDNNKDELSLLVNSDLFDGVPGNFLEQGVTWKMTKNPVIRITQEVDSETSAWKADIEIIEKGEITTINQDGTESNGTEAASTPVEKNGEEGTTPAPTSTPTQSSTPVAQQTEQQQGQTEGQATFANSSIDDIFNEEPSNPMDEVRNGEPTEQQQTISSTGGVQYTVEEKPNGIDDDDDIDSNTDQRHQRQTAVAEHLATSSIDSIFNDNTDEIKQQVDELVQQQQEGVESDEDKAIIEHDANDLLDEWVASVNAAGNNPVSQAGNKVTFLSRFIDPYTPTLSNVFTKSVQELIAEYAKLVNAPIVEINGTKKVLISLGDLVKLAVISTSSSFDENLATHLYDLFKLYLNTQEASQTYAVLDNGLPKAEVIDTLRPKEDVDTIAKFNKNIQRVDINSVLRFVYLNVDNSDPRIAEKARQLEEALHSLKPGDKLRVVKSNTDIKFYIDKIDVVNGKEVKRELEIGKQAMPYIDQNDGSYYMYVKGWRLDVRREDDGIIKSKLLNIFSNIFFGEEDDFVEIRNIIAEAIAKNAITNPNTLKQIAIKLADIGYIKTLVEESKDDIRNKRSYQNLIYIPTTWNKTTGQPNIGEPEYDNLLYELVTLWRHSMSGSIGRTKAETEANGRRSLQDYFDKVYSSYESTEYQLEAGEVEVEHISEGQVIRRFDNAGEAEVNRDRLPLTSEAVADKNTVSLGIDHGGSIVITNPRDGVARRESIKFKSAIRFGAYAVLYSRNAEPEYVNLYGARLGNADDMAKGTLMRGIANAAYQKLINSMTNFQYSLTDASFNELAATIMDIVNCKVIRGTLRSRDNIPLFRAMRKDFNIELVTKPNGMKYIEVSKKIGEDKWESFKIYQRGQFGPAFGYCKAADGKGKATFRTNANDAVIGSAAATEFMNWISNYACFNIDETAVTNEVRGTVVSDGFILMDDAGVHIHIPYNGGAFSEDFESYGDLVLNSGITRCNLGKNKYGRNFNPKGSVQAANQVLLVSQPKTLSQIQAERNTADTYKLSNGTIVHTNYEKDSADHEKYVKAKELLEQIAEAANNGEDITPLMKKLFAVVEKEELFSKIADMAHDLGIDIPLFPKKLFYNGEFNTAEQNPGEPIREWGPIAMARPNDKLDRTYRVVRNGRVVTQRLKKGWTMVGARWLNMFASTNPEEVNTAIRTLIHERLHHILHENISEEELTSRILPEVYKITDKVKKVVDEVVKTGTFNGQALSKAELDSWLYVQEVITAPRKEETKAEEFLVEAITSKSFYRVLNQIKWDEDIKENNKPSIFDKILEIINELLGWAGITKGSVYDKLLTSLRDFASTDTEVVVENETVDNGLDANAEQEEVVKDIKEIALKDINAGESTRQEAIVDGIDISDALDDIGIVDDEDSPYSIAEDPYGLNTYLEADMSTPTTATTTLVYTPNDIIRNLPIEDRNNFKAMVNSGVIQYKCS